MAPINFDNKNQVIEYLIQTFSIRLPKRNNRIYRNVLILHKIYPEMIEELIVNMRYLGSWKDYILLLTMAKKNNIRNTKVMTADNSKIPYTYSMLSHIEKFIYDILIKQICQDVQLYSSGTFKRFGKPDDIDDLNCNRNMYLSTLIKIFPNINTKVDTNLNFVNVLTSVLFPNYGKGKRRAAYANMCKMLKAELGLGDTYMAPKFNNDEYKKAINFNKLSWLDIKRHSKKIIADDVLREKYEQYLLTKYVTYDITKMINLVSYNSKLDEVCIDAVNKVWTKNYANYISDINEYYDIDLGSCDYTIYIDISKDVINNKNYFKLIASIVLINIVNKNSIYIIGHANPISFDNCSTCTDYYNYLICLASPIRQNTAFVDSLSRVNGPVLIISTVAITNDIREKLLAGSIVWELTEDVVKSAITNTYSNTRVISGSRRSATPSLASEILTKHKISTHKKIIIIQCIMIIICIYFLSLFLI